ncbi:hypothetical protein MPTK1_6g17460 [Marchantia polymorpha subsp. ruderalis]|uniref:Uncharacterized protein n=2 Tax=Marchantia polymorpha TaxID=3197 RepID=A0AAF6BT17_MARPO|nr:hypothetical protein MARPO_0184s0004 [Marchantia polymorpha]BBN15151.1 hypothetical protein Mp_6g17460 [Marchantia polymorpha subsp. ruderalis]|eukprot:PTQ27761.1 hypothetical protein MARPO_0184s0004 [Marchantia polymorpha]
MTLVSDIKLIRTDTTLDLSQKAEKDRNVWFLRLLASPYLKFYSLICYLLHV